MKYFQTPSPRAGTSPKRIMKYLITGNAGSGKTSVSEELRQRGLAAYDADEGFGHWIHKVSGDVRSSRPTENRGDYYWIWSIEKVERLLRNPAPHPVFFCGLATNQALTYESFDRIVVLACDLAIIEHRLITRNNNPFGKRPGDIDLARSTYNSLLSEIPSAKTIRVNAERPIKEVVDKILAEVNETR